MRRSPRIDYVDHDKREFARVEVGFSALVQPVDPARAEQLRDIIRSRPSVWAPTNESSLRDLAHTGSVGPESMLAQAVLELSAQIVRLRSRVLESEAPVLAATIQQISGGGGQLECDMALSKGDRLEVMFQDSDDGIPPIRALIEIVHNSTKAVGVGFRYDVIHPHDEKLLMRMIYQLQRQALRHQRL